MIQMSNREVRFGIHRYIEDRSLGIFDTIGKRTIIYLDMNYWIRLRKGAASENRDDQEFFDLVSHLHEIGSCIFPISEIVFWELLKQEDIQTRTATIQLIDRFSEGITIANNEHRMLMEIQSWMNEVRGKSLQPTSHIIWSNISTVMSYQFCQTIPEVFREPYLDFSAQLLLEKVIAEKHALFKFKDNVAALNAAIKAHAHENKTAQDMFLSEIGGIIAEHAGNINEAIDYEYFKKTGQMLNQAILDATEKTLDKFIYYGFKNGKITNQLPSLHIIASLHTWTRWIKKDFKDGNDTMDFMHASVALPYADYFLTERRLSAGIAAMSLDKTYNCSVHWQYSDVIACLKTLKQVNG